MNTHIPIDGQVRSVQGESSEVRVSFLPGQTSEAMALASGEGGPRSATTHRSPTADCNACALTLHELANTIAAVLMNAQVMEWRLPPYSRLKRPVREIERQAQRSSALLKGLLCQFQRPAEATRTSCQPVPSLHGTMAVVTALRPEATAEGPEKLPDLVRSPSVPASWPTPETNSHGHVTPALARFSRKRNDNHED